MREYPESDLKRALELWRERDDDARIGSPDLKRALAASALVTEDERRKLLGNLGELDARYPGPAPLTEGEREYAYDRGLLARQPVTPPITVRRLRPVARAREASGTRRTRSLATAAHGPPGRRTRPGRPGDDDPPLDDEPPLARRLLRVLVRLLGGRT